MRQESKRVALTRRVVLSDEKRVYKVRPIGYKVFKFAIDAVYGEDGILPDVGVSVLKTGSAGRYERF
jgi:hypothetical protein